MSISAFAELFASLRLADHGNVYAGASFWWTIRREGYHARNERAAHAKRRSSSPKC